LEKGATSSSLFVFLRGFILKNISSALEPTNNQQNFQTVRKKNLIHFPSK
jgi:hypothetical protein